MGTLQEQILHYLDVQSKSAGRIFQCPYHKQEKKKKKKVQAMENLQADIFFLTNIKLFSRNIFLKAHNLIILSKQVVMQEYPEDKQKSCVTTVFFFSKGLPLLLLWAVHVLWLPFPRMYIELQKQYTD